MYNSDYTTNTENVVMKLDESLTLCDTYCWNYRIDLTSKTSRLFISLDVAEVDVFRGTRVFFLGGLRTADNSYTNVR